MLTTCLLRGDWLRLGVLLVRQKVHFANPSAAGLHIAAALRLALSDISLEADSGRHGIGVRALTAFASATSSHSGLAFGMSAGRGIIRRSNGALGAGQRD